MDFSNFITLSATPSNNRSIGSPCVLRFSVELSEPMSNLGSYHFAFKPSAWVQATYLAPLGFPTSAYFEFSQPLVSAFTWYDTTWVGLPVAQPGNLRIFFQPLIGASLMIVEFYFIASYDLKDGLKNISYDNAYRLLKDARTSISVLNNSADLQDSYSAARYLHVALYNRNIQTLEERQGSWSVLNTFRFYNQEPLGQPPKYLRELPLVLERGASVSDLSVTEDTLVRLRVEALPFLQANYPNWAMSCEVFAFLLRTDSVSTALPFWKAYNLEYCEAQSLTTPLASPFELSNNGVWKAPSTSINNYSGNNYECTLTLDHTKLVAGAKYRVLHLWRIHGIAGEAYPSSLPSQDFGFISPEYRTITDSPCPKLPPEHTPELYYYAIEDHTAAYIGTPTAAAQEVLQSHLILDLNPYNADPIRKEAAEALKRIKVSLYIPEGDRRHVLEQQQITYNSTAFSYNPDFIESQLEPSGFYRHIFRFKVRADAQLPNLFTILPGGVIAPPQINQDWTNQTVYIETLISLQQDGYEDELSFTQTFEVLPQSPYLKLSYQDLDHQPIDFICTDEQQQLQLCVTRQDTLNSPHNAAFTNAVSFISAPERENLYPKQLWNGIDKSDSALFSATPAQLDPLSLSGCTQHSSSFTKPVQAFTQGYGMALDLQPRSGSTVLAEHVRFPHISAYEWGCEGRTFELWVLLKSLPQPGFNYPLLRKERLGAAGNANLPLLAMSVNSSGQFSVMVWLNDSPSWLMHAAYPNPLPIGQWLHLVWVKPENAYLATAQQLYVNNAFGNPINLASTLTPQQCHITQRTSPSGTPIAPFLNNGDLILGADYDCGALKDSYFTSPNFKTADVMYAAVTIYDFALSPTQVADQYQKGRGGAPIRVQRCSLIARFNQHEGYKVTDFSKHANDGLLPAYGVYALPVLNTCGASTVNRTFGYQANRVAYGGGAWVLS